MDDHEQMRLDLDSANERLAALARLKAESEALEAEIRAATLKRRHAMGRLKWVQGKMRDLLAVVVQKERKRQQEAGCDGLGGADGPTGPGGTKHGRARE